MGKKCSFNKYIKKMFSFLIVCLIAITLTGCDSSNRRGTGSLDMNATYASAGDYSITVGDLYDSLRYNTTSYLENAVFEFLFEKEIKEVKDNTSKYQEKLDDLVLEAIYGTSDEEEIADLTDSDVKIQTYIDNMKLEGYVISKADIESKNFSVVYPKYYLEVAKYVAAYNQLAEEFTVTEGVIDFGEITDESHYTIDDVIDYYEANYTNKGDVTAVLVRFLSSTEAANLLKAFGLKTYDGAWYQIPVNDELTSKTKYNEYYDDYVVNPNNVDEGIVSVERTGNGKNTILKIFVAIYNYIYGDIRGAIEYSGLESYETFLTTYTGPSHLSYYNYVKEIIDNDGENRLNTSFDSAKEYNDLVKALTDYDETLDMEAIVMSSDRLNGYNASLATYVYDTLATEAKEENETFTQYSTSAKSYGSYYYLVFKISEVADEELYKENDPEDENEDDDTEIEFTNEKLLNEILNALFEAELDDTYIHEIEHERIEDAKIKIYDSIIELQFMQSGSELVEHYNKTKKSNNNLIAEVKYQGNTKEISVDEAYAYLEPLYGPQQAMALLFNEYIKGTPYYTDLEGQYDDYVKAIENMLTYFANDYYASYGYPSSLGKYNFMLLYYRTANIEEAVRDYLMVSDAQSAFYQDILTNYKGQGDFFGKLKEYADQSYDRYYSLTATGLTVYVDRDEDGEKDELDATNDAAILSLAQELMAEAQKFIKTNVEDYATAITNLIKEYNDSARIASENPTEIEYTWAKYRKAGLYLESTSIGEVNNTNKTVDETVANRVKELYTSAMNKELGLTTNILDNKVLETETGYTILLITAGANPTSVKYEDEETIDSYLEIPVLNNDKTEIITIDKADYELDKASTNLIKVYVLDYLLLGDVYSLPTTTTTALDTFLLPLIQRYTSSASQYRQILDTMGDITFTTEAAARSQFLNDYITIQQNVADNYDSELYANWWTVMYQN